MRCFLIIPFLLVACSNEPSVPDGILQPQKMEAVLYDVMRADEMANLLSMKDSAYRYNLTKRTALYDTIFQLQKIDKETFQKSMKFYQGRPDLLKTIFQDLQKQNDSLPAQKKKP